MHHKDKDKKDISILLIEKNLRPVGASISEHNIIGTGYFLDGYGFNVEMVWSLKEHKFEDFEKFREEAENTRDNRYSNIKEDFIRKILERNSPSYELLRQKPITSIDDLTVYQFILAHPDWEDGDLLLEFIEKYPDVPVICPDEAASIGSSIGRKDILSDVIRDRGGVYILQHPDISHATVRLMEYLLDQRNIQSPEILSNI